MSDFNSAFGGQIKINRLPKNPMDKCTIVSVYPKPIIQIKPTIFPGHFKIDGAKPDDFELLVVGASSWFKEMDPGQPYQEISVGSMLVANSFIRDYTNALLGASNGSAPGLFFLPGAYTKKSIVNAISDDGKTFADMLKTAHERQRRWFTELVRLADIMWARTNGNPITINDDARMAAQILGLKDKPWMQDFNSLQKMDCKACGYLVNPMYPVCPNCKTIINEAKATELGLKFAS